MKTRLIANQSGSVSILIALAVASIGALMVIQMSSGFSSVQRMHARQRDRANVALSMQRIATFMRQSFVLAQVDSTCSTSIGSGFTKRTINGVDFCVPSSVGSNGFCVEMSGATGQVTTSCASSAPANLTWGSRDAVPVLPHASQDAQANGGPSGAITSSNVKNSITIPSDITKAPWRSCYQAACVRLVLCPAGATTCTLAEAQATQVIRLGPIQ